MQPIAALLLKAPHALKGAIKAACPLTEPELVLEVPLSDANGRVFKVNRLQAGAKGLLIVHLDGVNTPEAAASLGGTTLFIAPEDMPEAEDDEIYLGELLGLPVQAPDGTLLGEVSDLSSTPAHDMLVVSRPTGKTFLVPVHEAYIEDLGADPLVLTELGSELAAL